jgi:tetratricopeptide (TPR) repeat protein
MLERSEFHESRKDDPEYYGKRGLDPELIEPIVQLARAAGLRVAAHVTSRHDFRVAIEAGVAEIAHLPLEALRREDAELAAKQGVVVVTTALSHRPSDGVADLDALHKANLTLLHDAHVRLALGTDSQATVVDEVHKLASLGVFENVELLRMLTHDTPRWIFPERNLGSLSDGAEASFVALDGNPLTDLAALGRLTAAFKTGHPVELQSTEKPGVGQQLVSVIMARGVEAAIAEYHRLRTEEPEGWDFSEQQLNGLGYAMMQHGKLAEATTIFRLNCELFPTSSNVWDSLGESYMRRGDTKAAIENYERSLELNPANDGAHAKLKELRGQS